MNIYLCGPMTLRVAPNFNRAAFAEAARDLRSAGHDVFNPGENPAHLSYAECMRIDIAAVLAADLVAVLPRWDEGVGTRVEVAVALATGIPVSAWQPGGFEELFPADAGRESLAGAVTGWFTA